MEEVFRSSNMDSLETALGILRKIISNILNEPENDKFRNIRRTNKVLANKLFIHSNIDEVLKLYGFAFDDVDGVYTYFDENPSALGSLLVVLDGIDVEVEAERNNRNVDPEKVKERSIVLQKEIDEKEKALKDLQDQVRSDRIDKKDEMRNRPVSDSKANDKAFGATVKHYKDILPPPGRK